MKKKKLKNIKLKSLILKHLIINDLLFSNPKIINNIIFKIEFIYKG